MGVSCRSTSTTFSPLLNVARCMGGSFSPGGAPGTGGLLRSISFGNAGTHNPPLGLGKVYAAPRRKLNAKRREEAQGQGNRM